MKFPKIYKALGKYGPKVNFSVAIIENGKLVCSNDGIIMICVDFGLYVEDPEKAEGKVLSKDILKWMHETKPLSVFTCTETGIEVLTINGLEIKPYSGYVRNSSKLIPKEIQIYAENGSYFQGIFPHWQNVIPKSLKFKKSSGLNKITFYARYTSILDEVFSFTDREHSINLEFAKNLNIIRASPVKQVEEFIQEVYICLIKE